jgi:hypothetical protein
MSVDKIDRRIKRSRSSNDLNCDLNECHNNNDDDDDVSGVNKRQKRIDSSENMTMREEYRKKKLEMQEQQANLLEKQMELEKLKKVMETRDSNYCFDQDRKDTQNKSYNFTASGHDQTLDETERMLTPPPLPLPPLPPLPVLQLPFPPLPPLPPMISTLQCIVPPTSSTTMTSAPTTPCKLFVGSLPFSYSLQDIRNLFESVCPNEVLEVILLKHPDGRSKGSGFVIMANNLSALKCKQLLQGTKFGGYSANLSLVVDIAEDEKLRYYTKPPSSDKRKLFIGRLPFVLGSDEILDIFSPFGKIVDIKLFLDKKSGKSKGACFVKYSTEDSAMNALSKLNGTKPFDNEMWSTMRISVAP